MFDKFREECGVFGIYGHPEAANMAYLGLYALQHRGQESAGIAVSDGARVRALRAMGYVAEIFTQPALATLPGHVAIGHTRYSTAGESTVANAQPLLIECVHGQVGICHNGNIVNAREMRDELVRQGSIFQTNSDTEVVLHLFARSQAGGVDDALVEAIAQLTGAFSFAFITSDRLVAVRDPHGFRPLALGRLGDGWVVCSETCAMDLVGATYVRDVEPGEVLIIGPDGPRSVRPFPPAPSAHCIFEHVYFARPDSEVFGRASATCAPNLGRQLARETGVPADVVVPIPDSGVCAAIGYAEAGRRADALRAHPQPLRRPHLHRAGAVDPPLRREGEAEPGAQPAQGAARRPHRRLDRARHHQPQDRQDGARRRRRRGARAHQLSADDLAVLLRRRHAAAQRAHRRHPLARRDPQVPRGRLGRLPQPRGPAVGGHAGRADATARRATPGGIRWRSRATSRPICSWRSSSTAAPRRSRQAEPVA